MTDQRVMGAVSTVKGTINEGVGKLTGDRKLETQGKVQKVEGKVRTTWATSRTPSTRPSTPDP
jgi:uncharacterized protein YjbJ (UPF0337 family)